MLITLENEGEADYIAEWGELSRYYQENDQSAALEGAVLDTSSRGRLDP
jgi:hypothetical protein